ncbi:unnamed protein product (macronuclear) [Paramecium tetraurelia]|uniref:Uncharacterized protein n=1 Tax=Paramecium tetraurelia TaxID=5888 RepID=A0CTW9_PARTE|nr:uncharacterized protein GSPATT00038969001 [Paramecium tetraurelia]CAK74236.1 unnamed protein product [Paramecium tetraurelia]|eukprot:XP_001441633.1 hypothetical protein (macronuclear) [Paramecium tetraurelia strain d4-2]
MQQPKYQQFPLQDIQTPQQIEEYDELDDQHAYIIETTEKPVVVHNPKAEQMKNYFYAIRRNLLDFKELVDTMNKKTQIVCKPMISNIKERANDDQAKSYLCKLRTLSKIKKSYGLSEYLNKKREEEKIIEESLQKISNQFSFSSSLQLRMYARAFKLSSKDNFIYANLYHDRLSDDAPYLLLSKKDSQMEILHDQLDIKNQQLIIDLKGPHQRWISLSYNTNSIYEKYIYDYLKRNDYLQKEILQFSLEFNYIQEGTAYREEINDQMQKNKLIVDNYLFSKLLHELIIKQDGSMETYFQEVKIFILEHQAQDLTDPIRYQNLLRHCQFPENIHALKK